MTYCIKTGAWVWIEFEQAFMPADIYELHPYKIIRFPYDYKKSAFRSGNDAVRTKTHTLFNPGMSDNFFSPDGQNIIVRADFLKKEPIND